MKWGTLRMPAYFVTSTGTDIGKTYVTAGLVRHFRAVGMRVQAYKPLLSDFSLAAVARSDAGRLLLAMGEEANEANLDRITPWRYAAPLSPDMAAAREGRAVDFSAVTAFCRNVAVGGDLTLIEGVGGVMVPLDETHTVLDWMAALGMPAILVAGTYLGTISHILTAMQTLKLRKVTVTALVLNDSGDGAVPHDDTMAALRRFLPETPVVLIPRRKDAASVQGDFSALADILLDAKRR